MTGSLQIKNNIYYVVLNQKDENGKRKQKWIKSDLEVRGNKKRAEKFLRETVAQYEENEIISPKNLKFVEQVEWWLEAHRNQVDVITWQGYKMNLDKHIIPYFKKLNLDLKDITPEHIQRYYNLKFKDGRCDGKGGLSARSVKLHAIVINMVFKDAVLKNLIPYNPAERAKVPAQDRISKGKFYTVQQANKLLEVCQDEKIHPIIYLTLNYGFRRSEVMALKWDAVDFENDMLTVKRTVVVYNTVIEKNKTKNHSSKRSYPLLPEIKELLLGLWKQREENRKLFGKEFIDNGYIFTYPDGKMIRPDYVTKRLGKILKQHNLPHIRFHDLRHTCASILLSKGWSLKDIQEWLGHSDIGVTANIYTHIDITRKIELASSISNTFAVSG